MNFVYLFVYPGEKFIAMRMGCKWNRIEKAWYIHKDATNYDEVIKRFGLKDDEI